jgi:hypothetical protein
MLAHFGIQLAKLEILFMHSLVKMTHNCLSWYLFSDFDVNVVSFEEWAIVSYDLK